MAHFQFEVKLWITTNNCFCLKIVIDGENGYFFNFDEIPKMKNGDAARKLLADVAKLDRAKIRAHVEQRWTLQQMARQYEAVYRKVVAKRCADAARAGGNCQSLKTAN